MVNVIQYSWQSFFSKAIAKPIMAFNASKKAWVHRLSQENFTTWLLRNVNHDRTNRLKLSHTPPNGFWKYFKEVKAYNLRAQITFQWINKALKENILKGFSELSLYFSFFLFFRLNGKTRWFWLVKIGEGRRLQNVDVSSSHFRLCSVGCSDQFDRFCDHHQEERQIHVPRSAENPDSLRCGRGHLLCITVFFA